MVIPFQFFLKLKKIEMKLWSLSKQQTTNQDNTFKNASCQQQQ